MTCGVLRPCKLSEKRTVCLQGWFEKPCSLFAEDTGAHLPYPRGCLRRLTCRLAHLKLNVQTRKSASLGTLGVRG